MSGTTKTQHAKIIEQKVIEDWYDVMKLDIIDWDRLNGSWHNPADALLSIVDWFAGTARYMIVEYDLRQAPKRSDWPGWDHLGNHKFLGQLFWNTFYARNLGKLIFSDEPDFYGSLTLPGCPKEVRFFGDVRRVSAQTFALVQKKMNKHDLWISVLNEERLVIIENLVDTQDIWVKSLGIE